MSDKAEFEIMTPSTPAAEPTNRAVTFGSLVSASAGTTAETPAAPQANKDAICRKLRRLTRNSLGFHGNSPLSAAFFADKLVSMSKGRAEDVYLLAQAYYRCGQHRRVVHVLKRHNLLSEATDTSLRHRHLAALSLSESNQWGECLTLVEAVLGSDPNDTRFLNQLMSSVQSATAGSATA